MKGTIAVSTSKRVEMLDITSKVRALVHRTKVASGMCLIFCPHTTAGITINENADPDVVRDMVTEMNKIVPFEDGYRHGEGNSAAHIKSTLFGPSLNLMIDRGDLLLGTWQGIFFCEFDGPRERKVHLKVIEG